jgi:hypothetical protein
MLGCLHSIRRHPRACTHAGKGQTLGFLLLVSRVSPAWKQPPGDEAQITSAVWQDQSLIIISSNGFQKFRWLSFQESEVTLSQATSGEKKCMGLVFIFLWTRPDQNSILPRNLGPFCHGQQVQDKNGPTQKIHADKSTKINACGFDSEIQHSYSSVSHL